MISIIIPTLNSERYIAGLLKSVSRQNINPKEIIIIDSSSSDGTVGIAKEFDVRVISVKKEAFDHGGTRNVALNQSRGEIVVFLTHDTLPVDENALRELIKPLYVNIKIGAAYGRQLPYPDATVFGAHLRLFNYPAASYIASIKDKGKGIKAPFLSNSFAAYRKSALLEIGGFKENLISTEDTYAGAKLLLAGYKLAYIPEAKVYHSHNYTVLQEFKRYFDIGVFHKREKWIMEEFGKAEGEGIRYLKSEILYLMGKKRYFLLPEFFIRNGLKYIGFFLGRHYERMPRNIIKKISMHSNWWDKISV